MMIARRVPIFLLLTTLLAIVRTADTTYHTLHCELDHQDPSSHDAVLVDLEQSGGNLTVTLQHPIINDYEVEQFYVVVSNADDTHGGDTVIKADNQVDPFTAWMDMARFEGHKRLLISPVLENTKTGKRWTGTPVILKWRKAEKSWKHGKRVVFTAAPCQFYESKGHFVVRVPKLYGPLLAQLLVIRPAAAMSTRLSQDGADLPEHVVNHTKPVLVHKKLKVRKADLLAGPFAECDVRVNLAVPAGGADDVHTLLQSIKITYRAAGGKENRGKSSTTTHLNH